MDKLGYTPLLYSLFYGHVEIYNLLLKNGAKIPSIKELDQKNIYRFKRFTNLKIYVDQKYYISITNYDYIYLPCFLNIIYINDNILYISRKMLLIIFLEYWNNRKFKNIKIGYTYYYS